MESPQRRILIVDDDPRLLSILPPLLMEYSEGRWQTETASDAAGALAVLQKGVVDLVVVDVHMPLVDGVQFLLLLQKRFPGLAKVVLTGDSTGAHRQVCLKAGADLYLEKPRVQSGWATVCATLEQLSRLKASDSGFRGVLRRVGLQDVLQMECLARSSSVFEITGGSSHGFIYIQDGNFIHAVAGEKRGEEALNTLLALNSGEFSLHAFTEPPERTIQGQWEFLLMEAARKRDEVAGPDDASASQALAESLMTPLVPALEKRPAPVGQVLPPASRRRGAEKPRIDEVLLCSNRGDIWHEWQAYRPEARLQMLTLLRHKAAQLSEGSPLGQADQLEIEGETTRTIIHLRANCSLFVRSSPIPADEPLTCETGA